jgi:phosphonate transport system ATP-binding protein
MTVPTEEAVYGRIVFDGTPDQLTSGAARDIYGAGKDFSEAATSTEIETLDWSAAEKACA